MDCLQSLLGKYLDDQNFFTSGAITLIKINQQKNSFKTTANFPKNTKGSEKIKPINQIIETAGQEAPTEGENNCFVFIIC